MASTAINSQGAIVEINTGTEQSPTWTNIANISSFSGLDGEGADIDVTNLQSVAKEFRVGLKDFGGFSMEIHADYSDAGQQALRSAGVDVKQFQVTLSNSTTLSFDAVVKNADSINVGIDAVVTGTVSLKITGAVTVA
jgi:hypothetical protein